MKPNMLSGQFDVYDVDNILGADGEEDPLRMALGTLRMLAVELKMVATCAVAEGGLEDMGEVEYIANRLAERAASAVEILGDAPDPDVLHPRGPERKPEVLS